MFLVILILCFLLAALTLFDGDPIVKVYTLLVIFVILVIFAGTRTLDVGADYKEYIRLFSLFPSFEKVDINAFTIYEPTIVLLPLLIKLITANGYLNLTFLLYAILGVGLKILAVRRSKFLFLNILVYCSFIYYSQEMITIRAGVACGIFLWSIQDLEKTNDKLFLFKIGLAYLFHYSSILFLAIWLVEKLRVKAWFLFACLSLSILIAILGIDVLTAFKLDVLLPKVQAYLLLMEIEGEGKVNIFNFRILFSLIFLAIFTVKYRILMKDNLFNILYKLHLVSLILFFALSPTAMVFSLRVFDLLSVGQIMLFPYVVYIFKEQIIGYLILLLFCVINFFYVIYVSGWFITGYSSWLI